eukprot:GHVS01034568.1.p1 GENE.GHVS01034568.1~~GHVS01034568.1.p1  ORF type:complete len:389 (+),score=21.58 GHVS01034568.1:226-1392(+)
MMAGEASLLEDLSCHPSPVGLRQKGCHPVRHWLLCILLLPWVLVEGGELVATSDSREYIQKYMGYDRKGLMIMFCSEVKFYPRNRMELVTANLRGRRPTVYYFPVLEGRFEPRYPNANVATYVYDGLERFYIFLQRSNYVAGKPLPDILNHISEFLRDKLPHFAAKLNEHKISLNRNRNNFKFFYRMLLGIRLNEASKVVKSFRSPWYISLYGEKGDTTPFLEAWELMETRFVVAINARYIGGTYGRITDVVLKVGSTETKLEFKNLEDSESFVLLQQIDCKLVLDAIKNRETVKLMTTWESRPDKNVAIQTSSGQKRRFSEQRRRGKDDCPVPWKTRSIGAVPFHRMEYPADEEFDVVKREFQIGDTGGDTTIEWTSVKVGNHYSFV